MKLVRRSEFLKLSAGTVYSAYRPSYFRGLHIKQENCGESDFRVLDLFEPDIDCDSSDEMIEICDAAEKGGTIKLTFEEHKRDGDFEDGPDFWFAVWEPADVQGLITALQKTLPTT